MRSVFTALILLAPVLVVTAQEPKPGLVPVPNVPMPPEKKPAPAPGPKTTSAPAPAPAAVPAPAPPPPPAAISELVPEHRGFIRPKVPVALFTHEKTALLEVEAERIAIYLARRAAEKYTAAVLSGEREAASEARLMLTISLHLAPLNAAATHCSDSWAEGKPPSLPPPGEDLRAFTGFLLMAAQRQGGEPGSAWDLLARVLKRMAADYDPKNEDAVYASEIQDRAGKAPPLRELLEGTLSVK